jgi:hypothetical protein
MLYFSIILCIRQYFIIVTVYTIRDTDIPHDFLYYMFLPDVAIFRYIRSHNHLFLLVLLSPTLVSVYTLRVLCMYCFYVMPCVGNTLNIGYLKY